MAYILIFPLPLAVLTLRVIQCFVSTKRHSYPIPVWCFKKRLSTSLTVRDLKSSCLEHRGGASCA